MKKTITMLLVFILLFQVGCSKKQKESNLSQGENILLETSIEGDDIVERSENISDYIVELYGIDDSISIILNDTVLVAVVMARDSELTEDTISLIKKIVIEKDQDAKNVFVSNDKKQFAEITNIIMDLMSGKPYDNYVDKIDRLIKDIDKS